ncbi:MAG: TonB-dependent receptor [Deltaproteobacteria bacterium]|nr:TonB-dependent receptor [Deltaproteobacteria bacterium]MBF0524818.1 TonB-dependent receptor [Deltaproteobacteria bacterium]
MKTWWRRKSPVPAILSASLTIFLMFTCSINAFAESSGHLTLDEITVVDSASSDPQAAVVEKNVIEKGKNVTIPDVLKDEPDIVVSRRAGIGDNADILAIRGLSANRIMLNINGRPVNAAGVVGGYYIDWSTVPLDNIEKLEIIKGGSSAIYGNNALGGVVNVITKKPTEKMETSAFATYGGGTGIDGIQNYRLTNSYKIGPFGYSISGSFQKANPFLWNNDYEGKNFSSNLYVDMPLSGQLALGFQYANTIRGFIRENRKSQNPNDPGFYQKLNNGYPLSFGETMAPGSGKVLMPGPGAMWDKSKNYFDVGYAQPIGNAIVEFKAYKNYEDRNEKNYSSTFVNPSYGDGALVLDRKVESDRSYGGSLQGTVPLGSHELITGLDYKVMMYGDTVVNYVDNNYNGTPYTGGPSSNLGTSWGYYAQDTWKMFDCFTLTVGLRYDTYSNEPQHGANIKTLEDNAFSPKLIGTYRVTDADTVTASLYQALRTPGLPETYWWYNGQTHGNPELKPEKNNAAELAWQHTLGKKHLAKLTGYYYSIDDFIIFRNDPTWRGVYNIDKVQITGVSLSGKSEILSWLNGTASVTYMKTNKEGDIFDTSKLTDQLDYMPDWRAHIGLGFKLPLYDALFNVTTRYVGEAQTIYTYKTTTQFSQLQQLGSYVTGDLELKVPITKYGELSIYAENIFDKDYEERFGYPMMGRIIGTAAKITF